jgi:heat shock protein HslJ
MKKSFHILIVLIICLTLSLSACSSATNLAALTNSSWVLESYGPVSSTGKALADTKTSLIFKNNGSLSGNVGCNSFGGNFRVNENQLIFGPMMSTMMACPEQIMQQEGAVLKVFNGTTKFNISSNALTITSSDGQSSATFIAAQ